MRVPPAIIKVLQATGDERGLIRDLLGWSRQRAVKPAFSDPPRPIELRNPLDDEVLEHAILNQLDVDPIDMTHAMGRGNLHWDRSNNRWVAYRSQESLPATLGFDQFEERAFLRDTDRSVDPELFDPLTELRALQTATEEDPLKGYLIDHHNAPRARRPFENAYRRAERAATSGYARDPRTILSRVIRQGGNITENFEREYGKLVPRSTEELPVQLQLPFVFEFPNR